MELNKIYNEDCLEGMKRIPDGSVDMILCDLPYGTTACSWDEIINLDKLWSQYNRVIKDKGVIVLTANNPFTSKLIMNDTEQYSHEWLWIKTNNSNFLRANSEPLKNYENILVFVRQERDKYNDNPYRHKLKNLAEQLGKSNIEKLFFEEGRYSSIQSARTHAAFKFGYYGGNRFDVMDEKMFNYLSNYIKFNFEYKDLKKSKKSKKRTYNPQGTDSVFLKKEVAKKPEYIGERPNQDGKEYYQCKTNYPKAILNFKHDKNKIHPTQKPVALFEYLIKTYTNEGETVLDNCMGSGTTAIACINTNRNYIGFELDEEYYKTSIERINNHAKDKQMDLFEMLDN